SRGRSGPFHPPATTTRNPRRRAEAALPRSALAGRPGVGARQRLDRSLGAADAEQPSHANRLAGAWLSPGTGYPVPASDTGLIDLDRRDRLSRWCFWSLWSIIIVIAAAFYYEKAAEDRSAFVRWRPQVLQFFDGVNIYDKMIFPNPPMMPITLYPLMVLPTVTGAMCWFAIKVALTPAALVMCLRIVQPPDRVLPPTFRSLVLLLSLRPILGDLHHGNNNLVILFLIVAMLYAWRRGLDIGSGLLLGLATTYKVTPALFFVYFAYKRSWRTVLWGLLGLGIFLLIVPSLVIGPRFNAECLGMWWHRMITPYVVDGAT